jgi:hypothetical protein
MAGSEIRECDYVVGLDDIVATPRPEETEPALAVRAGALIAIKFSEQLAFRGRFI